ncbi:MAG: hypothetical protein FWE68_04910, partial [Defluviitaleaceae bacterium]|nr:hypothetical protein [Defluviitaleaceae bacterium]
KVRFKNKISEPLMKATDFVVKAKKKRDKEWYSLEFTVCKSMGISEVYSFDSHDEKLLNDLLDRIKEKGEFLFDEGCNACEKTIRCTEMDYDKYIEMAQCGELGGELKFGDKGGYVITV